MVATKERTAEIFLPIAFFVATEKEMVAAKPLPGVRLIDPAKDSVAVRARPMALTVARLPTNESVAVRLFVKTWTTAVVMLPAKLSVAVRAFRNDLDTARFPTNESVAVKPESRSFLVWALTNESVAVIP